jgi:CelD/BcsL family acetyltransferase involved in cellulose biosynthesis
VTAALPRAVASPAETLEAKWISDYDSLVALEPIWRRLVDEAGISHPFLQHEWIRTWWEAFGAGRQLRVLLVTRGREPVAIAPLMLERERFYGVSVRCLQLAANAHTQRCDIIVARDAESVYPFLWRVLEEDRASWDVLLLRQVPADSPTLAALPALAGRDDFRAGIWHGDTSPYLRLAGTWEEYLGGRNRKHRANVRNRLKRLEAQGPVALEVVREGADVFAALEDGFRIEGLAWKGRAGTAIERHAPLRAFYTRFALQAMRRGWLRLQFLTVSGRRIAFAYALQIHDELYLLKPGYDPAYAPYSPSALLCAFALRDAFANGLAVYDFLGADDPWKRDWAESARPHDWLFVFGRSLRARAVGFAKLRVVPRLRRALRLVTALSCTPRHGRA